MKRDLEREYKIFVAVMKGALGVIKKMLTNGGFVKLLWACVVLARAGKTLAVGRGTRITGPRAWQNSFNSFGKWLPRTCNQFGFQAKTSTTKF